MPKPDANSRNQVVKNHVNLKNYSKESKTISETASAGSHKKSMMKINNYIYNNKPVG